MTVLPRAKRLLALALTAVVAIGLGSVALTADPAQAAAPTTGRYVPIDTTRVWSGTVGTTPSVVPIAGRAGIPSNATAVVVNVQVSDPTAAGYVRVTPAGADARVATQNFSVGQSISNLATVRLAGGKVQVKLSAGTGTVFFDVSGYYVDGSGATYTPLDAARVFSGVVGTDPTPVALAGVGGVPTDATAVVVNTQVEQTTAAGYVRVTPFGRDAQVAAQVYGQGTAISNLVIVKLVDGQAQVKVARGTARVYMDVSGYYSDSDTGSSFVPIDTTRASASTIGTTPGTIRLTGTAGVPGTATGVVANAGVEDTSASGYLRVTPAGQDPSVAAQVFSRGQAISNLVMAKVVGSTVDRRVQAKVSAGTATLYLDVAGYFMDGSSGSGIGADVSWPQCGGSLPTGQAFAIVGVNGGLANNNNPCFSQQLAWAQGSAGGTSQETTQLYVNISNPGAKASVWPKSNTVPNGGPTVENPYGTCSGKIDRACSYMYGYTRAYEDLTIRNVSNPTAYRWWLDVETDQTTWQSDTTKNLADLEGLASGFRASGVTIGLYSTSLQLRQIAGTIPAGSPLRGLPSWIPISTATLAAAQATCAASPLTAGGRVEMVQYIAAGFDRNVSCV